MTDFWRLVFLSIVWSLGTLCVTLITFRENHCLLRFSESVSEYESVFQICVWKIIHIFFILTFFRIYWKIFCITLSVFSYSLGENKLVYCNKLLPFNIKSTNLILEYPHYSIICLYSQNINCNIFITYELFNLFWNMLISEAIENMSHYNHSYTKLSNNFLLIHSHEDLLHMLPICGKLFLE